MTRSREAGGEFEVVVADRSMEPSLKDGEILRVRPRRPGARPPPRGALVVVHDPESSDRWLIKRVFAVGGDRVLVGPHGAQRRPAGAAPLERPPTGPERFLEELLVPPDHLFVLSDRPEVGRDSRQFGALPPESIVGVAHRRARARRSRSSRRSGSTS
ncbi:MAG: signal peptidase I [Thermoplasmata archaeon]|nr:signal peptidase I [Thermoplasmata archaeon]